MLGFPFLPGAFFFSAWLLMIFWGIIAPDVGLPTIGYPEAMLVTIALWLVAFPATLVLAGGRWGWRRSHIHRARCMGQEQETVSAEQPKITAVFSGASRRISSKSFKGAKLAAVFGGIQLDLREAIIETSPAILDVTAVFGGIEIKVPRDWSVEFQTSAALGGTNDERKPGEPVSGTAPRLLITGTTVFGGVSVKD
jgi:predicted membrane protein